MVVKVLFVCHGNICRSPMAEFIMKDMARRDGRDDIVAASCAISSGEIGNTVHPGTKRVLSQNGIPWEDRSARLLIPEDYALWDHIVAMDEENLHGISRIIGEDPEGKVSLLMSHVGEDRGIDDPWFTGGFGDAFMDISKGCRALLDEIEGKLQCDRSKFPFRRSCV